MAVLCTKVSRKLPNGHLMSLLRDLPYIIFCLFAFASYKLATDPDLVYVAAGAIGSSMWWVLEKTNLDALLPDSPTVCHHFCHVHHLT